jgi:hypothetical protein
MDTELGGTGVTKNVQKEKGKSSDGTQIQNDEIQKLTQKTQISVNWCDEERTERKREIFRWNTDTK